MIHMPTRKDTGMIQPGLVCTTITYSHSPNQISALSATWLGRHQTRRRDISPYYPDSVSAARRRRPRSSATTSWSTEPLELSSVGSTLGCALYVAVVHLTSGAV